MNLIGVVHALFAQAAMVFAVGPDREVLAHLAWENRRIFQAREHIVVVAGFSTHPDEAKSSPRVAFQRPRARTIFDHVGLELQGVFREADARKIMVAQHGSALRRARVCQYVSISVVAVSLTKKIETN